MELYLKAIVLGIIEGITEFLPISSTGHLIIANRFIEFKGAFANMFDIVIQLGAILSVIVYFWGRLWPFASGLNAGEKKRTQTLWKKVIAGVVPSILIGGMLGKRVEEMLFNPLTVAGALLVGGVLLWWIESTMRTIKTESVHSLSYRVAVGVGLFQCIAMIPGTSRSAATIIGAMLLGVSRSAAAEFSFFLAIPTLCAASVYSLLKSGLSLTSAEWGALAVGFIVSFLVAWAVISAFMSFIQKHDFKPFAFYRIALGIFVFVYFLR